MDRSATISLHVPARAEYLHVVRSVVGAAALRLDLTYEALDDLRLAVDEAATRLLLLEGTTLFIGLAPRGRTIEVRLSTDADAPSFPTEEERSALAWTLLDSLVEEVDAGEAAGRPWIQLIKHAVTT